MAMKQKGKARVGTGASPSGGDASLLLHNARHPLLGEI
jgi:hypothetical protein